MKNAITTKYKAHVKRKNINEGIAITKAKANARIVLKERPQITITSLNQIVAISVNNISIPKSKWRKYASDENWDKDYFRIIKN